MESVNWEKYNTFQDTKKTLCKPGDKLRGLKKIKLITILYQYVRQRMWLSNLWYWKKYFNYKSTLQNKIKERICFE